MALSYQFLHQKAQRDVEKNWHYLPASNPSKKRLTTEEQARAYAEMVAAFECDVLQAWMTQPLSGEDRQVYTDCFVPAFLEAWRKRMGLPMGVEQPTLWAVS